jgi:hypothetical protein
VASTRPKRHSWATRDAPERALGSHRPRCATPSRASKDPNSPQARPGRAASTASDQVRPPHARENVAPVPVHGRTIPLFTALRLRAPIRKNGLVQPRRVHVCSLEGGEWRQLPQTRTPTALWVLRSPEPVIRASRSLLNKAEKTLPTHRHDGSAGPEQRRGRMIEADAPARRSGTTTDFTTCKCSVERAESMSRARHQKHGLVQPDVGKSHSPSAVRGMPTARASPRRGSSSSGCQQKDLRPMRSGSPRVLFRFAQIRRYS